MDVPPFLFPFCFYDWYEFMSSAIGLKTCAIIVGIKKNKSIVKKKKKKHDKIVLLVKSKLNRADVLVSKSLIDSNISHGGSVL